MAHRSAPAFPCTAGCRNTPAMQFFADTPLPDLAPFADLRAEVRAFLAE